MLALRQECFGLAGAEERAMSDNRIETRADGMAERIGDSLGLMVVLVVYAGIAWMVAQASGF